MTETQRKAVEKIKTAKEPAKTFEKSIFKPIADTLSDFCIQSEKFAKAVIDGRAFNDCIDDVAKFTLAERNKGNMALADIEVYRKAATFYSPNADIQTTLKIVLGGKSNVINIDFTSLL